MNALTGSIRFKSVRCVCHASLAIAHLRVVLSAYAAQNSFHTQADFARAKRFAHVIIGAELQSDNAIYFIAHRRQHENRYFAHRGSSAPDFATQIQPRAVGQTQVKNQQRRCLRRERLACITQRARMRALTARAARTAKRRNRNLVSTIGCAVAAGRAGCRFQTWK
jgi:hypothetical protein